MLKGVKAVAIDFDGVLTRLDLDYPMLRRRASQILGREVTSLQRVFNEEFGKPAFYLVNELVREAEVKVVQDAPVFKDGVALVKQLYGEGKSLYLTTMQSLEPVVIFLQDHGLVQYFKAVLTREDFRSKKEMFQWVKDVEGAEPREVGVVDDSERNIGWCRELGMVCVLWRS